jgi:hypothetical protein
MTQVAAELKDRGLRKRGTSFLADFGSTFGVAEVQKDKYNTDTHMRFTFNCGGGSEFLFHAVPLGFEQFEKRYGICPFMLRAGWSTRTDLWWDLNLVSTELQSVKRSIVKTFDTEIIPYFKVFQSDLTIFQSISDPQFPGLPERIRLEYLEAYKKKFGRAN